MHFPVTYEGVRSIFFTQEIILKNECGLPVVGSWKFDSGLDIVFDMVPLPSIG
jgi:hypothetical protein